MAQEKNDDLLQTIKSQYPVIIAQALGFDTGVAAGYLAANKVSSWIERGLETLEALVGRETVDIAQTVYHTVPEKMLYAGSMFVSAIFLSIIFGGVVNAHRMHTRELKKAQNDEL